MLGRLRMSRSFILSLLMLLGSVVAGCQPDIGDSCGSSRDCSPTGERQCDLAQPGGYCTILGCDPDTCPDGTICVEWRFVPSRTAETWCMKPCSDDGNCRVAYLCALPSHITQNGERSPTQVPDDERVARVLDLADDRATAKICAALVEMSLVDAGVEPDTTEQ